MRAFKLLPLLALFACLTGCANRGTAPAEWVEQLGGVESGPRHDRLEKVCRALLKGDLHARVRPAVLCCGQPAAYSWPSGEVFVTCGLIDLLSDDAHLSAAVAHEAGHLLTEPRHGHRIESLRGGDVDTDLQTECDADAAGAELLKRAGLRPSHMADMLRKVRDAADLSPQYHSAMTRRIERLETTGPKS